MCLIEPGGREWVQGEVGESFEPSTRGVLLQNIKLQSASRSVDRFGMSQDLFLFRGSSDPLVEVHTFLAGGRLCVKQTAR